MATLPTSLANMSLSELINVAKETPFRGDGMAVLHQVAEAFGRRADGKSVRQLIEVYSTGSSDSERERLGFLVRRIGSKEGLDALQQFVTSLEVSQASNLDALITFAAFALAVSGDGTRTNALLTAAARSTGSARLSLFDGAEHIESLEALPILISVADRSHPLAGDKDVLTMSIYLLGRIRSEKSRDKLQQLVSSGDPTIAQWAKEAEENLRSIAPGLYGSE